MNRTGPQRELRRRVGVLGRQRPGQQGTLGKQTQQPLSHTGDRPAAWSPCPRLLGAIQGGKMAQNQLWGLKSSSLGAGMTPLPPLPLPLTSLLLSLLGEDLEVKEPGLQPGKDKGHDGEQVAKRPFGEQLWREGAELHGRGRGSPHPRAGPFLGPPTLAYPPPLVPAAWGPSVAHALR